MDKNSNGQQMERCKEKKAIKKSIYVYKENANLYAKNEDTHTHEILKTTFLFLLKKKLGESFKKGRGLIGNNEVVITPSAEAKDI